MNDVSAWCGSPSATNPCLIRIMPGVYYIGANTVQMQAYVDIEGSGESVTKIKGNRGSYPGVVAGSSNAELRFISVENIGGGSFAYAVTNYSASPKITNVTAIASGANEQVGFDCEETCSSFMSNVTAIVSGGTAALGFYIDSASPTLLNVKTTASNASLNLGIDMNVYSSPIITNVIAVASGGSNNHAIHINGTSSPTMTNITAVASDATVENYGVYSINSSSPTIININAEGSGGTKNYGVYTSNYGSFTGGTVNVDHSVIKGTTGSVYTGTSYKSLIGNTRLNGSVTGTGITTCAGVYDENYTFYTNTCP